MFVHILLLPKERANPRNLSAEDEWEVAVEERMLIYLQRTQTPTNYSHTQPPENSKDQRTSELKRVYNQIGQTETQRGDSLAPLKLCSEEHKRRRQRRVFGMFTNATSFKASDTDIGRTEEEDVIMLSRQGVDTMPTSKNSTSERETERKR